MVAPLAECRLRVVTMALDPRTVDVILTVLAAVGFVGLLVLCWPTRWRS